MPDTRHTTNAVSDPNAPGHFLVTCDDGSTFTSRSFIDSPEGIRVVGSAPDGSVATDGPILTDDVRTQLAAVGTEGIPAHVVPVTPASAVLPVVVPVPGNLPAIVAHAASPVVAAASPHHAHLAGILHGAFSALEKVLGLAENPAVLALLPAKYQGYATAALLVEQFASGASSAAP